MVTRECNQYHSKYIEASTTISQLEEQLDHEIAFEKEIEAVSDSLQTRLESAQHDIANWERTVSEHIEARKEIESERDAQYERLHENSALTEAPRHTFYKEAQEKASMHGSKLQQLVESFSYDQRCHRETVIQWLDEFAANNNLLVVTVMQHADGTLSGGEDAWVS